MVDSREINHESRFRPSVCAHLSPNPIRGVRRGRFRLTGVLLGGVLLCLIAISETQAGPWQDSGSRLTVNTIPARVEESIFEIRTYAGVVKPARSSDLGFESGGRLESVLVSEGDVVTEGQPLARLDQARLELKEKTLDDALQRARDKLAELNPEDPAGSTDQQRARIRQLQQELDRMMSDLEFQSQPGATQSPDGMDRLRVVERQVGALNETSRASQIDELEKLEADLDSQLQDTRLQLDQGTLTAPFGGVVALRHVNAGAVVRQGMPIIRLVEQQTPLAWVGIPIDVAARIEPGQSAWLSVDGRTFTGTLKAKLPQLDQTTRTRTVILEFADDEAATAVVPGQVVNVDIWIENRQSGTWVPITALHREAEGLWSVYVVQGDADDQLVSWRYVEMLRLETDFALVRGTLNQEDLIIVNGIHRVVPGQRVTSRDVSDTVKRPGPGGEPGQ